MRIERVEPAPPPMEFALLFPKDEGWAVVAALREYAGAHPHAVHTDDWHRWAKELDVELRRA